MTEEEVLDITMLDYSTWREGDPIMIGPTPILGVARSSVFSADFGEHFSA
jgi:hypothetical protein